MFQQPPPLKRTVRFTDVDRNNYRSIRSRFRSSSFGDAEADESLYTGAKTEAGSSIYTGALTVANTFDTSYSGAPTIAPSVIFDFDLSAKEEDEGTQDVKDIVIYGQQSKIRDDINRIIYASSRRELGNNRRVGSKVSSEVDPLEAAYGDHDARECMLSLDEVNDITMSSDENPDVAQVLLTHTQKERDGSVASTETSPSSSSPSSSSSRSSQSVESFTPRRQRVWRTAFNKNAFSFRAHTPSPSSSLSSSKSSQSFANSPPRKQRVWKEVFDRNVFKPYYYNVQTKEVTWTRPADMDDTVHSELSVSVSSSSTLSRRKTALLAMSKKFDQFFTKNKKVEDTPSSNDAIMEVSIRYNYNAEDMMPEALAVDSVEGVPKTAATEPSEVHVDDSPEGTKSSVPPAEPEMTEDEGDNTLIKHGDDTAAMAIQPVHGTIEEHDDTVCLDMLFSCDPFLCGANNELIAE